MSGTDDPTFSSLLADAAMEMLEASSRPIEQQILDMDREAAELRAAGRVNEAEFLEMKARDLRFLHGGGDGDPA